jgi:hypothetical protein
MSYAPQQRPPLQQPPLQPQLPAGVAAIAPPLMPLVNVALQIPPPVETGSAIPFRPRPGGAVEIPWGWN